MNGNAVENPKWNSGSLSYRGFVTRNFVFASVSLTWNYCRSPARGTLHQLLLAWDKILAPLKSTTSSVLTLLGPWCSATGGEQQRHACISQWPRTHFINTAQAHGLFGTWSKSHIIQMFWYNISGKKQQLTSNSIHPNPGIFLLSFGTLEWYRIYFNSGMQLMAVFLTTKLL